MREQQDPTRMFPAERANATAHASPELQLPLFARAGERESRLSGATLLDAVYESRREDLRVYLALARLASGPVLELGAGAGRLLSPLLGNGVDAYGLERDGEALELGRERLRELGGARFERRLLAGDMTSFRLEPRFSLIIVACNTLSLLLEDAELDAALRGAADHLVDGGALVFDVSRAEGHPWYRSPHTWRGEEEALWVAGIAATTVESGVYDPASRRCTIHREFLLADGRRARTRIETRQRSIAELAERLLVAGLEPATPLDESGQPVSEPSTLAFFRASKRPS